MDKRCTYCGPEHLWSYCRSTNYDKMLFATTKELYDYGTKKGRFHDIRIPMNKPVEKPEKQYEIDPYVIGCYLGGGSVSKALTISCKDIEVIEEVAELIGASGYDKYSRENTKNQYTFFLPKDEQIYSAKSHYPCKTKYQTEEFFKDFKKELICTKDKKRIPQIYKDGSVQQRLSLIQGLMDTNGTITNTEEYFKTGYWSNNAQLVQDMQEVLNSLGYRCTILEDKRPSGRTYYLLIIAISNQEKYKLFRMSHKKERAEQAKQYTQPEHEYDYISIANIEKLDEQKEMLCIYVDNLEHLYLTNDYIVTHNTTLVRSTIDALGIREENVVYTSFTGKAAEVLRKKGNKNAMTLHKLLYTSVPRPDGSFISIPKITIDYKVVVVDEISMVPKPLIDLLFSHDVYVICCGDNFQLPPLSKEEDNHLLDSPHVFLDEIMRQEQESEIIRTSMDIRQNKTLREFKGKEVQILPPAALSTGMLLWADQILCATNATKDKLNAQMRELLGRDVNPEDGDKIICLKNYWQSFSAQGNPLVNGTIGYLNNSYSRARYAPLWATSGKQTSIRTLCADFVTDGDELYHNVDMDEHMILTGEKCVDYKTEYKLNHSRTSKGIVPKEFTYGYAITYWKAQGSEWDKVLIIEEGFPWDRETHQRALYTAITRAAKKAVIITK